MLFQAGIVVVVVFVVVVLSRNAIKTHEENAGRLQCVTPTTAMTIIYSGCNAMRLSTTYHALNPASPVVSVQDNASASCSGEGRSKILNAAAVSGQTQAGHEQ